MKKLVALVLALTTIFPTAAAESSFPHAPTATSPMPVTTVVSLV